MLDALLNLGDVAQVIDVEEDMKPALTSKQTDARWRVEVGPADRSADRRTGRQGGVGNKVG